MADTGTSMKMSMNKVIHGAIRRDLDRFVDALSRFPAGDKTRAKQLGRAWDNFDRQLTDHHEGEHEIAWPALESIGVTRATIAQMDAEHEKMATALMRARRAMELLRSTAGRSEAENALTAMMYLRDVTVLHLDHEEREIEPVYLEKADSAEMKEMGKKFARTSPVKAGVFFAWILDGISGDASETLTGSVPAPVLKVLTTMFGRRYRRQVAPVWAS